MVSRALCSFLTSKQTIWMEQPQALSQSQLLSHDWNPKFRRPISDSHSIFRCLFPGQETKTTIVCLENTLDFMTQEDNLTSLSIFPPSSPLSFSPPSDSRQSRPTQDQPDVSVLLEYQQTPRAVYPLLSGVSVDDLVADLLDKEQLPRVSPFLRLAAMDPLDVVVI